MHNGTINILYTIQTVGQGLRGHLLCSNCICLFFFILRLKVRTKSNHVILTCFELRHNVHLAAIVFSDSTCNVMGYLGFQSCLYITEDL